MNIDRDDPRLTAFVLGELDSTEHAVVEAYLIESHDCRAAVEEIRLTTRWLSEQLQAESRAHHQVEKTGINNHHAACEIVAKLDAPPRRGWGRPAIRKGSIAAAVLALVGLAVVLFVRVNVQPRREVEHVFQPESRKRSIEDQTNRDFARFGDAAPAPAAAPLARRAAGPVPKRSWAAADRGEGESRSFALGQGSPSKPAGEPANLAFQEVDAASVARGGQLGGMGGGANGNMQHGTAGRKIAGAGGSAPATPAAPRVVTATGAQPSGEAAKKPAPAARPEALVALRTQSRGVESRDSRRQPQLKNIKGAVRSAAPEDKKDAPAGAVPGATKAAEGFSRERQPAERLGSGRTSPHAGRC